MEIGGNRGEEIVRAWSEFKSNRRVKMEGGWWIKGTRDAVKLKTFVG